MVEMVCGKVCCESGVKGKGVIDGDSCHADENGDLP